MSSWRPPTRPWARGLVLLAGGALLVLPGCDDAAGILEQKAQEVAEEMSPAADQVPPPGPVLTDDEQLAAKLALYVECTTRASERIRESWQRYDERVDDDGTPRKKGVQPFLYKIDTELVPCDDAVAKGPTTAPPLPELESTMATWLGHARTFARTSVALDTYFEQQDHEDDDWAKSKALAPGLRAAYEAWDAADTELRALVQTRRDEVDRSVLALVEQRHGKTLEWHARNYTLAASTFVRCATAAHASHEPPRKPPRGAATKAGADAPDCAEAFTALEQAEAGFRSYHDAHGDEADAVFWMSAFEGSVSTSFAEATKVARAQDRRGKDAPREALDRLAREHDGLVSDASNLRFPR